MKYLSIKLSYFVDGYYSFGQKGNEKPNIVIIYAMIWDMGNLNCQNENSQNYQLQIWISGPLKYAALLMRTVLQAFCSPSRLCTAHRNLSWEETIRYCGGLGIPFFDKSDVTLPQVLKEKRL